MSSMYFQGGDFVELLSAQGKAPGAAWKLQGKISKTFNKGIRGNAFQLDGSSETKMQLPKASSSSLGLAQRFVVLQLLVPFTRSFSVEICFSDFQKVRRRFVAASAFRETARTALHVQLPLSNADVPRDQWTNLVLDLQSLSEMHFPDTGYRSMESICVGGSCRLKRIFTMKDAPTPSRGSQVIKHADVQDIPRQFVFSATQRGASGSTPIPTRYFGLESASGFNIGIQRVAVTADNSTVKRGTTKPSRRSQTAPVKVQTKSAQGVRTVRPTSGLHRHKALTQPESTTHSETVDDEPVDAGQQRLRTPVQVSTTGSKLRQPQSKFGKVVIAKKTSPVEEIDPPSLRVIAAASSRSRVFDEERCPAMADINLPRSLSPAQESRLYESMNEEATKFAVSTENKSPDLRQKPSSSVRSSLLSSSNDKSQQPERQSQALRQSILGEIQQKLASLEDDDEREDRRNRELFLRHISLHSGEWHLQQLRDRDLHGDDGALLSDDEDDHIQLSSSWRRELSGDPTESSLISSPEARQRYGRDGTPMDILMLSRCNADKESIFSFSSLVESKTPPTLKSSTKLFEFDSLLHDVKPLAPPLATKEASASMNAESLDRQYSNANNENVGLEDNAADELELTKLLAAKRAARQPTPQAQVISHDDGDDSLNQPRLISAKTGGDTVAKEDDVDGLRDEIHNLSRDRVHATSEREEWVIVEKDLVDVQCEGNAKEIHVDQVKDWHLTTPAAQEENSDIEIEDEVDALSMDLTSELSASDGEIRELKELKDVGDFESSVGPTSAGSPDKPESDHNSSKSSHHDGDLDDASSFDFEDLVEDAESSDDRDEASHLRSATTAETRQWKSIDSTLQENQLTRETPELWTRLGSVESPVLKSPPTSANRSKLLHRSSSKERSSESSHSIELSSSFSSRRLQRLLESTDWTAELNAQASTKRSSSPLIPPPARTRDVRPRSARSSSSTSIKRSVAKARASPQRPPSRPQTPSASSIELVYDPLLRCYYDPTANKYYALAE
ncbi:hypothetical protein PRIC1_003787 [Phytophthora ramorum]